MLKGKKANKMSLPELVFSVTAFDKQKSFPFIKTNQQFGTPSPSTMTGSICRPLPMSFLCSHKAEHVYLAGVIDRITNYGHMRKGRKGKSVTQNITIHRDGKVTSSSVTKTALQTPYSNQVAEK